MKRKYYWCCACMEKALGVRCLVYRCWEEHPDRSYINEIPHCHVVSSQEWCPESHAWVSKDDEPGTWCSDKEEQQTPLTDDEVVAELL